MEMLAAAPISSCGKDRMAFLWSWGGWSPLWEKAQCSVQVVQQDPGSPACWWRLPVDLDASLPGRSDTRGDGLLSLGLRRRGVRVVVVVRSLCCQPAASWGT